MIPLTHYRIEARRRKAFWSRRAMKKGQGNSAEFPGQACGGNGITGNTCKTVCILYVGVLSFWRHELRAPRSQRSVYFASRVAPLLAFFIGRRPKRKEEDAKEAIKWAFYFGKIVLPPAKPLQACRKRQFWDCSHLNRPNGAKEHQYDIKGIDCRDDHTVYSKRQCGFCKV